MNDQEKKAFDAKIVKFVRDIQRKPDALYQLFRQREHAEFIEPVLFGLLELPDAPSRLVAFLKHADKLYRNSFFIRCMERHLQFFESVLGALRQLPAEERLIVLKNLSDQMHMMDTDLFEIAIRHGKQGMDALLETIEALSQAGKSQVIDQMLDRFLTPTMDVLGLFDAKDSNVLMSASESGNKDEVEFILKLAEMLPDVRKAPVLKPLLTQKNESGETALMMAMKRFDGEAFLLFEAIRSSFSDVASQKEILVTALSGKNASGETAFIAAMEKSIMGACWNLGGAVASLSDASDKAALLEAALSQQNAEGDNALMMAIKQSSQPEDVADTYDTVSLVLNELEGLPDNYKIPVLIKLLSQQNMKGETALMMAGAIDHPLCEKATFWRLREAHDDPKNVKVFQEQVKAFHDKLREEEDPEVDTPTLKGGG